MYYDKVVEGGEELVLLLLEWNNRVCFATFALLGWRGGGLDVDLYMTAVDSTS